MTGLLVSVRDSTEAQLALQGGADVIDIKEPRAGSLGPAAVGVWREVADVVRASRPLSVALGELQDDSVCNRARQAEGMRFAKIGLAGCDNDPGWKTRWHDAISCLAGDVGSVGVVYADHFTARAPRPSVILQCAVEFRCVALLFDTHDKTRGHLFDHLDERELRPQLRDAKQAGLAVVLGGSLRNELVDRALELEPDYIAVRGAVCQGDRRQTVDRGRIESLARVIHAPSRAHTDDVRKRIAMREGPFGGP